MSEKEAKAVSLVSVYLLYCHFYSPEEGKLVFACL